MTLIIFESIKAIILGVVEGFTEFLPISSTGHLILVNEFISFDKNYTNLFDIVIQLGAILAVVFYFWKRLWPFTLRQAQGRLLQQGSAQTHIVMNKGILSIWYKTIIGVLPAIVLGALFASKIEEKLFNPWTVGITLFLGGIIILIVENSKKNPKIESIKDLSFKTAFFIGIIQCLSMIPGTSRSASTIIGAMVLGASRVVATEFSFFLAIPTMIAASTWSLLKYRALLDVNQIIVLCVGFLASFVVALAVVKFLINYVQKHNFKVFGWYRIALGLIIIAYFILTIPH